MNFGDQNDVALSCPSTLSSRRFSVAFHSKCTTSEMHKVKCTSSSNYLVVNAIETKIETASQWATMMGNNDFCIIVLVVFLYFCFSDFKPCLWCCLLVSYSYVELEEVGMLQLRHCFGKQNKDFPLYWHLNQNERGMRPSCLPGDLLSIVMYV